MSTPTATRSRTHDEAYETMLQTLSEGSVHVHFDPYEDIAWDAPEMQVDQNDPRWILSPQLDPLGGTAWYQSQPRERQIEIGRWRMVNAIKVGGAFESILIRGLMHYAMSLPNGSAEFRYCMHEMTEECNHIQMFQELVNRSGTDVPGMRPLFKAATPLIGVAGGYLPVVLMVGILAGEEPIDHYQKAMLREGVDLPPAMLRTMEIHIAEEARHISFADEFLRLRVPRLGRIQKHLLAVAFPVIMRWLAGEIMTTPKSIKKRFDIPDDVFREAFWQSPHARSVMASYFGDMRRLCTDVGLMTPMAKRMWKRMGIDGEPSNYRGEPDRRATLVA
ncbi:diiron oxygenase [Patulibacter sp. NPDC049589]|uniref:AurF N-oxygenase family protein n=1 Tax=Patulibacter sp. NPDC049589 TaxID=3154731 RepID=UPI0034477649